LTRQERKKLMQEKKDWQTFSDLLTRALSDLNRSTKFDEACEVLENFIYLARQLFRDHHAEIEKIINKLQSCLEQGRQQMHELREEIKPNIEKVVEQYNSEFYDGITFDGDVDEWFNRTFPLVVLYVKKKLKQNDLH